VKYFIAIFLITFSLLGAFVLYQNSEKPKITNLVRNYVSNLLPRNESPVITLKFTGDVILARSVNFLTIKNKDFTWAFKNISDELKKADLTIINLESPLIDECPLTNEGFIFCGDKRHVIGISHAGIDIVGLANNHSGNFGEEGIRETVRHLEEIDVLVSGVSESQIAYKKVHDTRFAFLAFNSIYYEGSGVKMATLEFMRDQLVEARKNADFVVVQMHWGNEYTKDLTDYQKNTGKFLIDNGADLVIGNHPHWIQDYEVYNGKYILYALGNFIFDQEWSSQTKQGVIANFKIRDNKVLSLEFTPIEIKNYGQVFKSSNFGIIPQEIK